MPSATRVFLTVFLDLVGFGIVLPLLPSYGARFTASATLIGALVATDSLLTFLLAPRWGRLSDRIGRRPVLLIGLAGSAVSYLVFGLAGSFLALLLSRVISGATGATVHVAQAYLADITPPERRSHAMGLIGAAFGLGFTIGPAIGGSASLYGDALPGLIAAGIAAANFLFAFATLPETEVRRRPDYRPLPRSWARFTSPFGVMFASTLAFTAIYVSFPLYSQDVLGYGRSTVSSFFVIIGLITIVVQGRLIGSLAPRFGERRLVVAGSILMAAGFGLFAPLAGTTGGLITAIALLTTGFCLVGPSLAGLVSRRTAREEQGGALGMLQSVGAVARIVGPPAAGFLAQVAGPAAPFYAAAGAAALAAVAGSVQSAEEPAPANLA
ncbi:MAG TPA: MFS transporter [Gemmatimonadales bacterium]|nr:MFS transporter [Gemmatimonadales bacterium]